MVTITKSCPKLRYLGREGTFEVTVTNTGNQAAHNVVVVDTMTGADFVNARHEASERALRIRERKLRCRLLP